MMSTSHPNQFTSATASNNLIESNHIFKIADTVSSANNVQLTTNQQQQQLQQLHEPLPPPPVLRQEAKSPQPQGYLSKFLGKKPIKFDGEIDKRPLSASASATSTARLQPEHVAIQLHHQSLDSNENHPQMLASTRLQANAARDRGTTALKEGSNSNTSRKLLLKQQTMLQKQKKMLDEIQRKNDSQSNHESERSEDKKDFSSRLNNLRNTSQPLQHRNSLLQQRSSKILNPLFMSTVRQKILEAEKEQKSQTTRARLNNFIDMVKGTLMNFMLHPYVEIFMGIATIFSLYSEDLRQVTVDKNGDLHFYVAELVVLVLFLSEIVIFSFCKKKYFFGFNFWMDLVSSISILIDIPFVTQSLFGFTIDSNQVSVLKY